MKRDLSDLVTFSVWLEQLNFATEMWIAKGHDMEFSRKGGVRKMSLCCMLLGRIMNNNKNNKIIHWCSSTVHTFNLRTNSAAVRQFGVSTVKI